VLAKRVYRRAILKSQYSINFLSRMVPKLVEGLILKNLNGGAPRIGTGPSLYSLRTIASQYVLVHNARETLTHLGMRISFPERSI